ncbi:LysR family transcriptional regulator [Vibrio gallicus]|uniref:LysR family transcriptional regulator n=1 Tax=Vibrio gallicus TaxID=190897 RepID=UPI0021C2CFB2|nr:LysR family transcriptional regulator [Vibrio gallicus]
MAKDLFFSMDLNLLRTFLVLYQELNTRKAAERLYVSQPAVSQALQKLRGQLGDKLFVKVPSGLKATPFSEQLAIDIIPHLNGISNTLNKDRTFEPLSLNTSIKIAVAPIVLTCLSGSLYQHFSKVAPNCTLELLTWKNDSIQHIQSDEITLGVSLKHSLPQGVKRDRLTDLTGQLIVRKDHPIQTDTVTAREMEPYPIASLITPGHNDYFTEAAVLMEQEGLNPCVGFRSELTMALIDVIEHTDFFMPHSDLFPLQRYPSLKAITPFINGAPYQNSIYAYYHMKYSDTSLMQWLVEQVQLVVEQERKSKH